MVRRALRPMFFVVCLLFLSSIQATSLNQRSIIPNVSGGRWDGKSIVVEFKNLATNIPQFASHFNLKSKEVFKTTDKLYSTFEVLGGQDVDNLIRSLWEHELVEEAQKDVLLSIATVSEKLLNQQHEILPIKKRFNFEEIDRTLDGNSEYKNQWHLKNVGFGGHVLGKIGEDVRAVETYKKGITGRGVAIGVLDDGIDEQHPDFAGKINFPACHDFVECEASPAHKSNLDGHGTAVAGLALASNDNACGVGVAFNSTLVALRVHQGTEASLSHTKFALGHQTNVIDVYSISWTHESPYADLNAAIPTMNSVFKETTTKGRNGKGSIYVFAAGDNKESLADTNESMLRASPYTITVASSNNRGEHTAYSTPGASVFISAPAGDVYAPLKTSDRVGSAGFSSSECSSYAGTSSSAPIVAGGIALMLEANPELRMRDVMHILSLSANKIDEENDEWQVNGGNRNVSHLFGFGRLDTARAVDYAKTWKPVPEKKEKIYPAMEINKAIPNDKTPLISKMVINDDLFIEHVQVYVYLTHENAGEVSLTLTSPSGTKSFLKAARPLTLSKPFAWTFTSVMHWGESSKGTWTLSVMDTNSEEHTGILNIWAMTVSGMEQVLVPSALVAPEKEAVPTPELENSFGYCCESSYKPSCNVPEIVKFVCEQNTSCCLTSWSEDCVKEVKKMGVVCPAPEVPPELRKRGSEQGGMICSFSILAKNLICSISTPVEVWEGRTRSTRTGSTCSVSLPSSTGAFVLNFSYLFIDTYDSNVAAFVEVANRNVQGLITAGFRFNTPNGNFLSDVLDDWYIAQGVLGRMETKIICV